MIVSRSSQLKKGRESKYFKGVIPHQPDRPTKFSLKIIVGVDFLEPSRLKSDP